MGSSGSTQNDMENREDSSSYAKAAKVAGAVAAGVGVLAVGAVALLSTVASEQPGATADEKTMKAPGRQGARISRAGFEDNPKGYFRDLRNEK